jgi:integrase
LVLSTLRRIENKRETAKRVLQNISQVMRYAVATGRCIGDPTPALRGALPSVKVKHMAAPTEPVKVGEFLRMLEAVTGGQVVESAVRLLPYLFVRPGEFRQMQWKDVDFESKEWRFVATKTDFDHIVPLSRQAINILSALKPLTSRNSIYVFPNGRTPFRPMTDAAQCAAYRRLGIDTQNELTAHGWRAVARTLLHEKLGFAPEVIEHQLAHKVPDNLGRAYNRTKFLDERKRMMQAWADYLDELRVLKTV